MTMNRWFRTGNEQFELVVYDFLSKYFRSRRWRGRNVPELKNECHENANRT